MNRDYTINRIRDIYNKLSYLDNLDNLLEFPKYFIERYGNNLAPVFKHYGKGMKMYGMEAIDRKGGEYDIKQIARRLCEFEDPDEFLSEAMEIENNNLGKPGYDEAKQLTEDYVVETYGLLKTAIYEFISVINFGVSIKELWSDAARNNDEAMFKLLQIDKSVMTYRGCNKIFIRKQYEGDWEFFRKAGKAISKNPYQGEPYLFKAILIVAYLWDDNFSKMTYKKIVKVLTEEGIVPKGTDPTTFRKTLNRVGLKKSKYNKK